MKETIENLF